MDRLVNEMSNAGVPSELQFDADTPSTVSGLTPSSSSSNSASITAAASGKKPRKKGGRPVGSSKKSQAEEKRKIKKGTEEAALQYEAERMKCSGRCPKGTLQGICEKIEKDLGLKPDSISPETVRTRIKRGNPSGQHESTTTPLRELEPVIVEYCVRLARIGRALTRSEVVQLTLDLVECNPDMKEKYESWKQKYGFEGPLSASWYQGFLKRHRDAIRRSRARLKDINRQEWATYENFKTMYEKVYQQMVEAGVAKKLEKPVWMDKEGNEVATEAEAFGEKVEYVITHPEHILFVDETGVNTNMKDDGNVGGELFLYPTNESGVGNQAAVTDLHFTVLNFTAATGETVMVAVILKSEQHADDIPMSWKMGIDPTIPFVDGPEEDILELNKDSMTGGPKCTFRGKEIPCFVGTSPKASITSELLVEMMNFMDERNIWERGDGKPTPFLLLDGHHSRLELPFLNYIHNKETKWEVCIGVPYGTHLWQVADASEQNGKFKINIYALKREWIQYKDHKAFSVTDIIPLVKHAHPTSFGDVRLALKAIAERGWGPLNRHLLKHRDLMSDGTSAGSGNNEANSSSGTAASVTVDKISIGGVTATEFTDRLLEEELKKEGRRAAVAKRKQDRVDNHNGSERLKKAARVTSGSLASRGQYHLSAEVHNDEQNHHRDKVQKEKEAHDKRQDLSEKRRNKAQAAYKKIQEGNELGMEDYKALLIFTKEKGDQPVAKNKEELKTQWNQRKARGDMQKLLVLHDNTGASESRVNDGVVELNNAS